MRFRSRVFIFAVDRMACASLRLGASVQHTVCYVRHNVVIEKRQVAFSRLQESRLYIRNVRGEEQAMHACFQNQVGANKHCLSTDR